MSLLNFPFPLRYKSLSWHHSGVLCKLCPICNKPDHLYYKKKKNLWIKYVRSGGIIWNTVTCTLLIPNKTFSGIADVHAVQEGKNEWTAQQKGEKKDDGLLVIYVRLWEESHQETSRRLMTKLRAYCEVITVFFTVGSERYIRCSSGLSSRASDSLYTSSKQHHLQYYCTGETLF